MAYKDEFISQWDELISNVDSEIIRQINSTGRVDILKINNTLKSASGKWEASFQYQGIWLDKIKKINPDIAMEFERIIGSLHIEDLPLPKEKSIIPTIVIAVVSGIAAFFLASFLNLRDWQIIGTAVLLPVVVFGSMRTIVKDTGTSSKMDARKQFLDQLNPQMQMLIKLCERLDK